MPKLQPHTEFGKAASLSTKVLLGSLFPLLVLIFNPLGVDPVLVPRMLFAVIVGLGLSIIILTQKFGANTAIRLNKYWVIVGGVYVATTLASLATTISIPEGILDLNRSLLMGCMLVLFAILLAVNKQFRRQLIWGVWVSAWLLLLWGGSELLLVIPSLGQESVELYKVTASMAHKNLLASAYLLLIPFVLYMFLIERSYLKFSSFLLLVGLVVMVLMLQGRSSWVAFAAMLVAGSLLMVRAYQLGYKPLAKLKPADKFYIAIVGLTIVLVVGALAVKKPETFDYMLRKISSMTDQSGGRDQNKETIHERYALWSNTWQLIKEEPITGVGAGSWKLLYPKYGLEGLRSEDGYTLFQRPHNDLLWVWSEQGLFGFLAYATIFLMPLVWLFFRYDKVGSDKDRLLASCAALAVVGFMVVGLFSFPRERIFHNLLVVLSLAIIMDSSTNGIRVTSIGLKVLVTVLLASFSWVSIASLYRVKGDMHTLLVHASYGKPGQEERLLTEAEKAKSFFYSMDPMATPMSWFQGVATYQLGEYAAAKQYFLDGLQQNPYHLHLLNNLGSTYEQLGKRDSAIITYSRVLDISPKYTEGLLNLSAVYFNDGQLDSAFATIDRCPIATTHASYQVYLKAILKAKLNRMILAAGDDEQKSFLIQLMQNGTALVPLYQEAKAANISFEELVIANAN